MTQYVLKIKCRADGAPTDMDGTYVFNGNPDYADGAGKIVTVLDPRHALTFPDQRAALEYWRTQSQVRPLRPDGKPNRPMTAFTVLIEPLEADLTQ